MNIDCEYFKDGNSQWIFNMNIKLEYCKCTHTHALLIAHEHIGVIFQVLYHLDSFIQYVGQLPTIATRDYRIPGHCIAFKKVNNTFIKFNDGMVHEVELEVDYTVNLLFYWRADVQPMVWDLNFWKIARYHRPHFPDLSLWPPLITPPPKPDPKPTPTSNSKKKDKITGQKLTRKQPPWATTSKTLYLPDSSDESDQENNDSGEECTPPKKGKFMTIHDAQNM